MKFLKNSNSWDCGPVCFANLFIWCGVPIDYEKQKHYFISYLEWKNEYGVDRKIFTDKLLAIDKTFKCTYHKLNPSFDELKKKLTRDKIAVIGVDGNNRTHVGLILKITKKFVFLVNWDKQVIRKLTTKQYKELVKDWSIVFIIEKV